MQTLTATELIAQKSRTRRPIYKIVLTEGANSYTYEQDRIIGIDYTKEPGRESANVMLDNHDGTLTSLDFKGYKGVIHLGFRTTNGAEYSARPPLYVVPHQLISDPEQSPPLRLSLALAGITNLLAEDRASGEYTPDTTDTDTVKTLFRKIAGDTGVTILSVYNHCTSYDVTFDSEDDLIDSYVPKDSFAIYLNHTRLSKLQELLRFTQCVMQIGDDGKIHIQKPIISTSTAWVADTAYAVGDRVVPTTANEVEYKCTSAGTSDSSELTWPTEVGETVADNTVTWTVSFVYEYKMADSYHTFFNKTYRKRLVIPNYIQVDSLESQTTAYTGFAKEASSSDLIEKRKFYRYRVSSNQDCTDLATARLSQYQLDAEGGHGIAPMNIGAELYDFVKITDRRQNDYVVGNISYLRMIVTRDEYKMEFRFGKLTLAGLMGTVAPMISSGSVTMADLMALIQNLMGYMEGLTGIVDSLIAWHEWFSGYIYITADGDIILNPKVNRKVHITGDLSQTSDQQFGLMLATAIAGYMFFYDNAGAVDHQLAPETTGHGKIGTPTYKWLSSVIQKAYHDTRLKIPVGTDMYD